ncbi:hypothetical protein ACL02T_22295 [Pseudonocardia sp. RS010]|uniref:hypothetical protein n=1 Tax=Pseudonocardia sp. RS010 TaxID=3385979 RepID=UPI0039A108C8
MRLGALLRLHGEVVALTEEDGEPLARPELGVADGDTAVVRAVARVGRAEGPGQDS